jgi:ABC-2 type transport system permease protein
MTATVVTTAPTLAQRTGLLTDIATVFSRELRPTLRNPFSVVFSMIQPLFFLALFSPLLPDLPGGSALQWFVPGIVVMSCLMGASMTGSALLLEMQTGSHERMLVSPLSRHALLIGRALKEIVPIFLQAVIILAIVTPFGFDLHVAGVALGLAILAAFCIGVGALSYALALASKNADWMFWTVQQTLIFPVLLLAGMLLPVEGGPGWLQTMSNFNPLTYVVDAERALFSGELFSATITSGAIAAVAVGAFGLFVGSRSMRNSD